MNLQEIYEIEPWEWPEGVAELFFETLKDSNAKPADRLLAAEMAGDYVVANDKLANALVALLQNNEESLELRSQAAISLGPALEHADIYEFDDPDDIVLTEAVFQMIQDSLKTIYSDPNTANEVRRSVIEASIRAPQEWHQEAVAKAYLSDDEEWRLTAVFCMSYIGDFKQQVLEALKSDNPNIHYQAVLAAGHQGLEEAWPHIEPLLSAKDVVKPLIFAAIEAAIIIGSPEAMTALGKLLDSEDDEVVDAVHEAMAMLEGSELEEDDIEEKND